MGRTSLAASRRPGERERGRAPVRPGGQFATVGHHAPGDVRPTAPRSTSRCAGPPRARGCRSRKPPGARGVSTAGGGRGEGLPRLPRRGWARGGHGVRPGATAEAPRELADFLVSADLERVDAAAERCVEHADGFLADGWGSPRPSAARVRRAADGLLPLRRVRPHRRERTSDRELVRQRVRRRGQARVPSRGQGSDHAERSGPRPARFIAFRRRVVPCACGTNRSTVVCSGPMTDCPVRVRDECVRALRRRRPGGVPHVRTGRTATIAAWQLQVAVATERASRIRVRQGGCTRSAVAPASGTNGTALPPDDLWRDRLPRVRYERLGTVSDAHGGRLSPARALRTPAARRRPHARPVVPRAYDTNVEDLPRNQAPAGCPPRVRYERPVRWPSDDRNEVPPARVGRTFSQPGRLRSPAVVPCACGTNGSPGLDPRLVGGRPRIGDANRGGRPDPPRPAAPRP